VRNSQLQQYFWQQMAARVLPALNRTIGVWEANSLQIDLQSLAPGTFGFCERVPEHWHREQDGVGEQDVSSVDRGRLVVP
jgi:hypothetical protein